MIQHLGGRREHVLVTSRPRTNGRSSATVETLVVFAIVFVLQRVTQIVLGEPTVGLFALTPSFVRRPWTLVTSVYAHSGLFHLATNAIAVAILGLFVERTTTRFRFHAYFVTTGALAGLVQVVVANLLGPPIAVLGASGAAFALFGYLVAANLVSDIVIGFFEPGRGVLTVLFLALAIAVTLATAAPGVALLAHFAGLFIGLVSGRVHLLSRSRPSKVGA